MKKIGRGSKFIPLIVGSLLWIGIPLFSWYVSGWSGLERMLTVYAMPVGLTWNALVLGMLLTWFCGNFRACFVFLSFVVLLGLLGNEWFGNWLCRLIEPAAVQSLSDDDPKFAAVVLLGGCTHISSAGIPELKFDGQRLLYTAQLYHAGRTPKIITTGGLSNSNHQMTAAAQATYLLTSIGVPSEKITELGGHNTRTEMKALANFFVENPLAADESVGLITNAAHIPRAMRLAQREGLKFIQLPSAHLGSAWDFQPGRIVPTRRGIFATTEAFYEILARITGQ